MKLSLDIFESILSIEVPDPASDSTKIDAVYSPKTPEDPVLFEIITLKLPTERDKTSQTTFDWVLLKRLLDENPDGTSFKLSWQVHTEGYRRIPTKVTLSLSKKT